MDKRAFSFLDIKVLKAKPRQCGKIEIRGPYYEAFTVQQFKSLLETWGYYIDGLKFAGGVQALLSTDTIKAFTSLAHQHQVYVNTGGFIERIVIQDPANLDQYLTETKALGFDIVEVSSGMFEHAEDFPLDLQIQAVRKILEIGLQAKPEITLMSSVGGGIAEINYEKKPKQSKSLEQFIDEGKKFMEAGASSLMIESEGITEGIEDPENWRKDVIFALIEEFGIEILMFEVSPEDQEARRIFKWFLKEVNPQVNLMMNSKNIIEFNAWRAKLWGDTSLWKGKKVIF